MSSQQLPGRARAGTPPSASVTATLWQRAAAHDPNDVFRVWHDGAWRGLTCNEVADRVGDIAGGLIARGVAAGDRVALLSRTRLDWALTDLAVLSAGAVTVPVGAGASAEHSAAVVAQSGARLAVVESTASAAALTQAIRQRPEAARLDVVVLDDGGLDDVAAHAADDARQQVAARVAATAGTDAAMLIPPPHGAVGGSARPVTHSELHTLAQQYPAASLTRNDTVLLCHPLDDLAGRVLLQRAIQAQAVLAFPRGRDTVLDDLQSFSPTVVSATADVFEQLVDATRARSDRSRSRTFDFAVTSAVQWARQAEPGPLDTIRRSIADKLVYRDLRDAMGGQARSGFCAHPALAPQTAALFAAADIPIVAQRVSSPPR